MSPEVLQYGAFGLLAAVLWALYQLANKLFSRLTDRLFKAADHLDFTLSRIVERLDHHELADEKRHAVTIEVIRDIVRRDE